MYELGQPLSPWLIARALTARFPRFTAALLSLALLALQPAAIAATADPIAETNDTVSDNAVAENNAETDTDDPIIVDLDVPPELQAFLAAQEASRAAENAAADQASDATPAAASASESTQTDTPQQMNTAAPQPPPAAALNAQQPEQNLLDDLKAVWTLMQFPVPTPWD